MAQVGRGGLHQLQERHVVAIGHIRVVNRPPLQVFVVSALGLELCRDSGSESAPIRELYMPDWKIWFPAEGDPRHGTAEDPRMVLIGVDVHSAVFLEVNKPQPVVLSERVKGWVTGTRPDIGERHTVAK